MSLHEITQETGGQEALEAIREENEWRTMMNVFYGTQYPLLPEPTNAERR